MNATEKPSNSKIIKALIAARKVITEPRKLRNADTGKYRYAFADLDEVLDCVVGPCLEQGIIITQTPVYEGGHAGVQTTLMHDSGETLDYAPLLLPAPRLEPQGAGICISYARRYALLSIFNLAQVDEDGAYNRFSGATEAETVDHKATQGTQAPQPAPASSASDIAPEAWVTRLENVIKNSGIPRAEVLKNFGIKDFVGVTKEDTKLINEWIASQSVAA